MYENSDIEELRVAVSNLNYRLNEVMDQLDKERGARWFSDVALGLLVVWQLSNL